MSAAKSAPRRRRYLVLGGLGALAVILAAWAILHRPPAKTPPPHAIPVTAIKAQAQDFQLAITALGAAQAWTSDMIFAQVSGKLIRVNFKEGSEVRAGQLLAEVDPRPFQAALTQAEGTLKRDEASLAGARRDLERYQHLQGEGGASRQQLEDEEATVGQDEGTVEIDRGAVAAAKLNLEFCRIVSPINGRAGVRLVDPGNLVSASGSVSSVVNSSSATSTASPAGGSGGSSTSASNGPTSNSGSSGGAGIVVINQLQPIAVTFSVPQGEFQRLVGASGGFSRPLPVRALSQETGELLDTGVLTVADNRVDQSTGTVELKARFANSGKRLWPGQFLNVSLGVQNLPQAVVLPLAAVNRGPKGQYVFVIGADHKVAMRPIAVLSVQGQEAVIKSGVNVGDLIVTDGQMVLNNGSLVRLVNPGAAPASGAPASGKAAAGKPSS
ncbi:efflux RND transporter periplasmic adaptor subunit [Phenylobacterium sp.]|uniref:efflux RND transporter periplasmic adaptor subunit n=1 Tax=Phenylobacterium sp. TaxID=1871053 RepID=UPI0025F80C6B|nr:efflux RND transporter periplasmic adaptor subunit [Phenylobacterium sp.]